MTTQKAAFLSAIRAPLTISTRPIPTPGPNQVLIRNRAIALNPLDWKRQSFGLFVPSLPAILGSDSSGTIIASSSPKYPPGTRILAITPSFITGNPNNSTFQEYTLAHVATVSPIPASLSHTQAVTLATATGVAALLLNDILGLEIPGWEDGIDISVTDNAILVWGGASSVGNLTIQLAVLAGYTVFATASGRHHEKLKKLGVKGVVDYKDADVVSQLEELARKEGKVIRYAVDAVSSEGTVKQVGEVLRRAEGGRLGRTLPMGVVPEGVEGGVVGAEELWGKKEGFARWLYGEALPKWLEEGKVVPLETRVIEGGLEGIQAGLDELKEGASGEKFVVELEDEERM